MSPVRIIAAAFLALAATAAVLSIGKLARARSVAIPAPAYPETRKDNRVDTLHGVPVADPYRWLEDLDAPETRAWIEAQNKLTFSFLESIPARGPLRARLTKLWNYERYGNIFKRGGRYFYSHNDGLQNQNVLFTLDSLAGKPKALLDPNALSADGTVSLAGYSVSEDGAFLAYGLSASGSDWETWRVRRIATGEDLPDSLERIKFSWAAWARDGSGFFYGRYDGGAEDGAAGKLEAVTKFQKLYFHRLGQAQSRDELVYETPDQPEWGFSPNVTQDGRYLVIHVWKGTDPRNLVFWKDLSRPRSPVRKLISEFDAKYDFLGAVGSRFYFLTDKDAPRGRLVTLEAGGAAPPREVVPEARETLQGASLVGGWIVAQYLQDAHSLVRTFAPDGKFLGDIGLPGLGSASGFDGRLGDRETFFSFTGFTTPATVYRHDFATGETQVLRKPEIDFDGGAFETRQVFYPGKDGCLIPMFLVHKRGLERDGNRPVYLYGYGGFNISITPSFSVGNLAWLEMGGVLAMPNLRGGGEYGEEWHQAGAKANKQTVFDDFIGAAEWLIREGYTRPARLAIAGGSNGGLLVGACLAQRPDLFGAAVPAVGVLDMLRFHKFTIGWAWVSDYGSPDSAGDFRTLLAYSPLHNLKAGLRYPATLITTADHDDRVVPSHSFKFAAALQAAVSAPRAASAGAASASTAAPVLIRIETKAGHGSGKPVSKVIEETADKWAFLAKVLDIPYP